MNGFARLTDSKNCSFAARLSKARFTRSPELLWKRI